MEAKRAFGVALTVLSLACAVRAQETPVMERATPSPARQGEVALPALPASMEDRFRELAERDPAAFRDLLRRDLSARLIRADRDDERKADLPVELATRAHAEVRN